MPAWATPSRRSRRGSSVTESYSPDGAQAASCAIRRVIRNICTTLVSNFCAYRNEESGMGMMDILGRYADTRRAPPPMEIEHDFEEVSHEAGPDAIQDGIAEAFRSDDTPPFEEMVAQLF